MPPSFRRLLRWSLLAFAVASLLGLLALGTIYYVVSSRLPDVQSLRNVELQEPMYVHARDGRLMALFGEARRYPVDIARVPERVKQAFVAIEDNRFYQHHGVDYKGVARAIWLLATTSDKRVPGGSTITQQVAKQFYLSSEYSFTRKFVEMLLAMKMERELSKDEIFELYLNKSFFGNRAYGIGAAAEFYYGRKVDELALDEMATLAAIPKFPSSGNPVTNPERARIRRDYVLERMRELGFISRAEEASAQAVPMHAAPHDVAIEVEAPYVAEMVRREMIARFGGDVLSRGYHVTTTIDPTLQGAAQRAVHDGLIAYDHRHGWRKTPERHFDLDTGETAATAAKHLRGIPAQGGLKPAIVLRSGDGSADVALADGSLVILDAASSRWTGRNPAALVARGDLVRVRLLAVEDKKDADTAPRWQLDQMPQAQAALVSLDPEDGALRALVGGFSFAGNKFNRATQARRQPGSSFKPFLYAAAMERGFNPASIVLDAPVVFKDRRGHEWRPQNDSGDFAGPMRLREALVQSRNLVSVRLLDAIGIDYARRYISNFGIDEALLPPNLSMSLGTASLPPLMIARGYAAFPNGGFRITPWFIDEVRDRDGNVLFKEKPATACPGCAGGTTTAGTGTTTVREAQVVAGFDLGPGGSPSVAREAPVASAKPETAAAPLPADTVLAPRAIDARVAYQLVSMMRDVVQRGTGFAAKVLGRPDVAGKTGSTNDHRDAWFSGFGGDIVTTVWVGRDDFRSLGYREYGGKAALPIWIDYMRVALADQPVAANDPPPGMVQVAVNAQGRMLPAGSPGIVEWVKVDDVDRMQADAYVAPEAASQDEAAFDIF
ncbi:MAG: penicillin-binding protein 1A [Luteimonas sp.]